MDYENTPLSILLQDRDIFSVFDDEFQKGAWLDVTALLSSESTFQNLYEDGTVSKEVLDAIDRRLKLKTKNDKSH